MPALLPQEGVYVCVGHIPLWITYPDFVTPLWVGQAQREGALNLRDLAPFWEPYHPQVGGTAGTFALRAHMLSQRPDAQWVGICQYRKFVTRERINKVAALSYRVMDVTHRDSAALAQLGTQMLPTEGSFLFSRPRWFNNRRRSGGYLRQYALSHRGEDLLRFAAEAASQGVLGAREIEHFMNEQLFVPGGIELGVFPTDFWLPNAAALESVMRACVERYPPAPQGYQARAWAFCGERLGSWLLLRHLGATGARRFSPKRLGWLAPSHWSRRLVGQLNLVTEGDQTRYVGGT